MNCLPQTLICALAMVATVGGAELEKPPPDTMSQTPVYTETEPAIEVEAGREFTIALDSNPTTGYSWDFTAEFDREVIALADSRFQPPRTRLKGAGGRQFWTFQALKEGQTRISLQYFRPWEEGIPPVRTAIFSVSVRGGAGDQSPLP